jgi:hypothetical protein
MRCGAAKQFGAVAVRRCGAEVWYGAVQFKALSGTDAEVRE